MTNDQFDGMIMLLVAVLFISLLAFCWMLFYPWTPIAVFGLSILSLGAAIAVAILVRLGYEAITSGSIL